MENEILELEFTLGNGSNETLKVKDIDPNDWCDIEKGSKALLCLVNNQQMLIDINSADDDGVSFSIGSKQKYYYESNVISKLLVEVKNQ
jgi:hypothetical protein